MWVSGLAQRDSISGADWLNGMSTAVSQARTGSMGCLQQPFRAQRDVYSSILGVDWFNGMSTTTFQSSTGCLQQPF